MKFFLLLIVSCLTLASEIAIDYKSYNDAKEGSNKIQFDMESTKAGFITTGFTGVVKKANISYQNDGQNFKDIRIQINVLDIDTDIDARNEKMYELCFESTKHPQIIVTFNSLEVLGDNALGIIQIRGESFPVSIKYQIINKEIVFNGELSLKGLKIPDPSIFIAKVSDVIKLSGKLKLD